jgi:hypothetical protein
MSSNCTSPGNNHYPDRMQHKEGTTFSGHFLSFLSILLLAMLLMVCLTNRSMGQSLIIAEDYGNNLTSMIYPVLYQGFIAGNVSGSHFESTHSGAVLSFSFDADKMGKVASFRSGSSSLNNEKVLPEWTVLKEAIFKLLSIIIVSFFIFFVIPGVGAYIICEHIP